MQLKQMSINKYNLISGYAVLLCHRFIIPYRLFHGVRQSPVGKAAEGRKLVAGSTLAGTPDMYGLARHNG